MTENFAQIGDVKLCYEILGKEDGYPILLIQGFHNRVLHHLFVQNFQS
jgi:hypothetical protein